MSGIKHQQEHIKNLLQLIEQNPDLPIVPMVDSEIVCSDDYGWWVADWGTSNVDEYWCADERCYIKSNDYDDLVQEWIDNNFEDYINLSEKELDEIAEKAINNYEWVKAIMVHIVTL